MILTLTLNPAVDISTTVDRLRPDHKLRCDAPRYDAGGGGINVSKAIHRLGGTSLCLFPTGGAPGMLLEELVTQEQLAFQTFPIAGWTRQSFVVTESTTHQQFRFGLPGPVWTEAEGLAMMDHLSGFLDRIDFLVVSGSLPPGVPVGFCAEIAWRAKKSGVRLILDTSGEPLKQAIRESPFLLKPNVGELAALVGTDKLELNEVEEAAQTILQQGGCELMVVSLGPAGAYLFTKKTGVALSGQERTCFYVPAPTVKKQSTVGAGDSMVGGMVYGLSQGQSYEAILQLGVACGTAATMNPGTELFHQADVTRLLHWIKTAPGSHNS
ncbi:1-phosphofructokinase family hexose kinase [Larkinella bovis]|uniref:1-phosphofructokinase family hexose kinase n=1 Tax=Larkinella bovis TaxID=683041 RepID=A0ABW0IIY0_9BACT